MEAQISFRRSSALGFGRCVLAEDLSDYLGRWKTIVCRWHMIPAAFKVTESTNHLERRHYRQLRERLSAQSQLEVYKLHAVLGI